MALTLLELRDKIKRRADMVNNPHFSDTKANDFINYAVEDLYDLIQSVDERYFVEEFTPFVTVSGQSNYSLPSDFYKLLSVNAKIQSDEYRNITRYNHSQRNNDSLSTNYFRYDLVKDEIKFVPTPQANTTIKLEYVPNPPILEDDADEWVMEQFTEYIIVSAGIMALQSEESDSSELERRLEKLEARVVRYVKRDDSEPASVSDVQLDRQE